MKPHISLTLFFLLTAGILSGCANGRFYAVDRPREDQAHIGNAGYIGGEKKDDGKAAVRPTRRIYVFEFDKKKAPEAAKGPQKSVDVSSGTNIAGPAAAPEPAMPPKEVITVPYIGDDETPPATTAANVGSGMLYTVTKDDTLQKISKKVYGTFGKWTKIYDANKDKIKNPNFVKPGTVLEIPPAQ